CPVLHDCGRWPWPRHSGWPWARWASLMSKAADILVAVQWAIRAVVIPATALTAGSSFRDSFGGAFGPGITAAMGVTATMPVVIPPTTVGGVTTAVTIARRITPDRLFIHYLTPL